jgi:hypothetical protein
VNASQWHICSSRAYATDSVSRAVSHVCNGVADVLQLTRFQPHHIKSYLMLAPSRIPTLTICSFRPCFSFSAHVLLRLVQGQVDVENDFKLQIVFKERKLHSKNWWKIKINTMCIWLDYRHVHASAHFRQPKQSSWRQLQCCQPDQKLLISQDHRASQCDDSKLLAKAVSSLLSASQRTLRCRPLCWS